MVSNLYGCRRVILVGDIKAPFAKRFLKGFLECELREDIPEAIQGLCYDGPLTIIVDKESPNLETHLAISENIIVNAETQNIITW